MPETAGPMDLDDVTHQALMLLLGAQSRREVLRSRHGWLRRCGLRCVSRPVFGWSAAVRIPAG